MHAENPRYFADVSGQEILLTGSHTWNNLIDIIQGDKKNDLVVAFGVELNGMSDMGDILVSLSNIDGDSWSEPVHVFDHRQRQGSIPFAHANPALYRAPGQAMI